MTFSTAVFIYEVWAVHMVLADTGIGQAGIALLPGNGNATDNYELCIYHTSRTGLPQPISSNPTQVPIGGKPRAIEAGVTLTHSGDWIEVWEDHMNCANISHILFDRPTPDYSWPSLNNPQHYPISPSSTCFDFDSVPYNAYADHLKSRKRRFEYEQERKSHSMDRALRHTNRRRGHWNDDSEDSDTEAYDRGSTRRHHHRREREYQEEEHGPSSRPTPKKYKYASMIAENVTANAVGDIFSLLFESALGAIF
ncbi:hypothetical protein ACMFMG_007574 [Clarireedia jacksonii]